jgi:hypothetical protein
MSDARRPERRTLVVVLLDGLLGAAAALQSGHLPWARRQGPGARRTTTVWLGVAAFAVTVGTALLVLAFLRAPVGLTPAGLAPLPAPRTDAASSNPAATTSAAQPSSGAPAPSRSASRPTEPSGSRRVPPRPPSVRPALLRAQYEASGSAGLLGYRARVTISNTGPGRRDGWLLTVTLPRSTLTVSDVSGAVARQDGATWSFTPNAATARISSGASVTVAFVVRGATLVSAAPTDCAIDGRPCAGVPR